MNGLLFFHQGWTDIVNCLAMISIFAARYKSLFVILRSDAIPMVSFYIRGLSNVMLIPVAKSELDKGYNWIAYLPNAEELKITGFEFMGHYDIMRPVVDKYKNAYNRFHEISPIRRFEYLFYESYDIPYIQRVSQFVLYRNPDVEGETYNRIVKREPYICVHQTPDTQIPVSFEGKEVVNLDSSSDIFFDMIRVLQHATEIHLIDSVWAAICYMIDGKYGLLETTKVFVYPLRGFDMMFTHPVKLPNWTVFNASDFVKAS